MSGPSEYASGNSAPPARVMRVRLGGEVMEQGQRPNRRLRLQRRLRGWSQEDVAAGLHHLAASLEEPEPGVDATMVSRWERGMRKPRPRYVRLLCTLFELPAEELGILAEADVGLPSEQAPRLPAGDEA